MTTKYTDYDKKHIWHPYTSMNNPLPVFPVASAKGVEIILENGQHLIDGMSSWWSAIHGYNHPTLNKAMENQISKMSHIMFGGLTHYPAVALAQRLVDVTPKGLEKVFFCDSGSVAVEVAMKMAVQFFHALGKTEKQQFATIRSGYHGDTWNAMSVCDPTTGMHSLFQKNLPIQHFAPQPKCSFDEQWNPDDFDKINKLITEKHSKIAGVILEPIVQGAGAMWFYHPEYLNALHKRCQELNILLIFDEIATGFGRTGKLFATEYTQITPDILCLGKAITGGMLSFATTMTTESVATTISNGTPSVFMHGPTFMGNPLACATACASIDLLLQSPWEERIRNIQSQLEAQLLPLSNYKLVKSTRVLGAIGVVETTRPVSVEKAQQFFVDHGVWIRPFGNFIYIMPPFIIKTDELSKLTLAIEKVVKNQSFF